MGGVQQYSRTELQKIRRLNDKRRSLLAQEKKYIRENRIEFFGIRDEARNLKGPNPLQARLLKAWLNNILKVFTFTGANRIGKTTIATILGFCTVFGKFPWNNMELSFPHFEPRKVRYVGQDWEKHIKTVVIPAFKQWWPKNRELVGGKPKKNTFGVEAYWEDKETGGSIEIMSNKQESDLHEGWSGDLVIYDEPPKRDVRVANARGLIDREGRELFAMTLLKEAWINREVIHARLSDGKPDPTIFNVHGEIYANLGFGLTMAGIEQFKKALKPEEEEARIKGIPSYMSGLVYPEYDRGIHLINRFKIPLNWIVDIAIDIHPRERQAVLFVATDPRNDRYASYEIWEHGDGTSIAEQIIRIINRNSLRVENIIVDPLAKGDSNNPNTVYDKISDVLAAHGYSLDLAFKDKDAGILEVRRHLIGPNKKPSLFIFNDLVRTIYEIEGYMYDKDTQKPQDKDDHQMENIYRILLLDTQWHPMVKRPLSTERNWKVL